MRARQPIPEELTRLAGLQSGVVSREQVLGTGFGSAGLTRLVRSGIWVRVSPGIYLTAAVPISWTALAWSGVLIGGDAARLGGRAAAFLQDLVPKPPDQIEVLVPASPGCASGVGSLVLPPRAGRRPLQGQRRIAASTDC